MVRDVVELMPALVEEFAAKAQRQRDDVDRLAATAHALAKGQPVALPQPVAEVVEAFVPDVDPQPAPIAEAPQAVLPKTMTMRWTRSCWKSFNEAESHLTTLVSFLADCAQRLPQPVTDALQRALHTLKGKAHMAGILPVAEIATPLEKMVKEFKTNLIQMDLAEAELLHEAEPPLRGRAGQSRP